MNPTLKWSEPETSELASGSDWILRRDIDGIFFFWMEIQTTETDGRTGLEGGWITLLLGIELGNWKSSVIDRIFRNF